MSETNHEQIPDDEFPSRRSTLKLVLPLVSIVLGVVIVLGSFFAVRTLISQATAPTPIPTATLIPGSDLFYIQGDPSWGSVSVDGHTLSSLPDPASGKPIQLSRGIHGIVWSAEPFMPQRCLVYVPPRPSTSQSCTAKNTWQVRNGSSTQVSAAVIAFTESLAMLPGTQRTALIQVSQATLARLQATETVQPGESYANIPSNNHVSIATQPLRATLRFHLDTNPNSNFPCASDLSGTSATCENAGQDCHLFCSPEFDLPDVGFQRKDWNTSAVLQATWEYKTLDGHVVAQNQPDAPDINASEYLLPLSISWDGSKWHVTLSSVDPACTTAENTTAGNQSFSSISVGGTSQMINWQFAVGSNRAAGCLAAATLQPANPTTPATSHGPVAYCLYRFGILLAANALAHRYWPQLPIADAYEQSVAIQSGKKLGF